MADVWSANVERLLRAWNDNIYIKENSHRKLAIIYNKRFYQVGLSAIILGTLVTGFGLSTFRENNLWLSLASEIGTGVVTCIVGVQTFMGYQSSSQKHHEAANRYQALKNIIQNTMALRAEDRGSAPDVINSIRQQYDDIGLASPLIPEDEKILDFNVKKGRERKESSDGEDVIVIDIDLDGQSPSHGQQMKMAEQMQREMCGAGSSQGVMDQLRYQFERFQEHTSTADE